MGCHNELDSLLHQATKTEDEIGSLAPRVYICTLATPFFLFLATFFTEDHDNALKFSCKQTFSADLVKTMEQRIGQLLVIR